MNFTVYLIENNYYLIVIDKGLALNFLPNSYTFLLLNKENFDMINSDDEKSNHKIFGDLGFYLDESKNKIDVYRGNLEKLDEYIIGLCQISLSPKNKHVYNIRQIVVKKQRNLGSVFYNIVFNYIQNLNPNNSLTSDRESISSLAKGRWEKIFNNSELVQLQPKEENWKKGGDKQYLRMEIDNYNNGFKIYPKTPQKIDDEYGVFKTPDTSAKSKNNKFLNYLYQVTKPNISFNEINFIDHQKSIIQKIISNNFIIKAIIKNLYKSHEK